MTHKRGRRAPAPSMPPVIAHGNAALDSSSPGHPPRPCKGLLARLKHHRCVVVETLEYLTSQKCSICCPSEKLKFARCGGRRFKGALVCNHQSASNHGPLSTVAYWDRDVNAARNIRTMFEHQRDNAGAHPP